MKTTIAGATVELVDDGYVRLAHKDLTRGLTWFEPEEVKSKNLKEGELVDIHIDYTDHGPVSTVERVR